jgi:Flp pilus assembly protein TadG
MSKRHAKRGSSLPETVIIMICFLALMFGLMDFGRLVYTYAWLFDIGQKAQRWAIVRGSNCTKLNECQLTAAELKAYIQDHAFGIPLSGFTTLSAIPGTTPGTRVTIYMDYTFNWMFPFMPKNPVLMSTTSRGTTSN